MKKDISIIIPTFNRASTLDITIDSYCIQQDVMEILIMDDCSTDTYENVISRVKHKYNGIKFIYSKSNKRLRQAAQKKLGVSMAKGKYILFGEDDVFLSNNYTCVLKKKILDNASIQKETFWCEQIYYDVNPTMCTRKQIQTKKDYKYYFDLFDSNSLFGNYETNLSQDTEIPFGHSLYMVKKTFLNHINIFCDYKGNSFREESDTQLQLLNLGITGYITPETMCCHLSRDYTFDSRKQQMNLSFHYHYMKSNRIFWTRNSQIIKKYVNSSPKPIREIVLHDLRYLKFLLKQFKVEHFK